MSAPLRRGLAAAAIALGVSISVTACSTQPAVIASYNPSLGIGAEQNGVRLNNVVIVSDGTKAFLSGGLNALSGDSLVGAAATQIGADGNDGPSLPVSGASVPVPAGQLVQLDQSGLAVGGNPTPGLTARILFNFEKAGVVTMTVPIVSSKQPDYATVTPKAAASSASSASASPSASAGGSASASASPSPSATPSS